MTSLLAKLLLLLSVLLMPLTMSTAAASIPADHQAMSHESMSDESMGHCPDSAPAADSEPGIAPCTMACAAALPAIGPGADAPVVRAATPLSAGPMKALAGVLLEIATPPPRTA